MAGQRFFFLGEAVGGAFGGRRLQVVEVAGFFLELRHALAHVVEQAQASVAKVAGDVFARRA